MTSRSAVRTGRLTLPSGAPERAAPRTIIEASRRLRASLAASGFEVLDEIRLPRLSRVDAAPGASGRSVRVEFTRAGHPGASHTAHVFEHTAEGRWSVARSSVHEAGHRAEVLAFHTRADVTSHSHGPLRWWTTGTSPYRVAASGASLSRPAETPVHEPVAEALPSVDRYGASAASVLTRHPEVVSDTGVVANAVVARVASVVARALAVEPVHTRSGAAAFAARALAAGLAHPSDAVDVARLGPVVLDDAAPERLARGLAVLEGLVDGVPLTWVARHLS